MSKEHGNLSINSENIFPIIKKWLYSDHDIFYRELISNGCDAITKRKKLDVMGEASLPDDYKAKIEVHVDSDAKTIVISDNGIGMTSDEVEQYINQIAFSGVSAFLEKYKDKTNDDQIIGHFGLGFYSAFMVADRVTIDTLSYLPDAKPVFWECDNGTEYDMSEGSRTEPGTTITLYLNEDSYEFANEYRAREVIEKYCSFMPSEIYLINDTKKADENVVENEADKKADGEASDSSDTSKNDDSAEEKKEEPKPLNDTMPLWAKHPNECTDEEYKEFYRKVFHDYKEPLFWIHLNMDYPFNLKGILYFPKMNNQYDTLEGTIKLYNNQVFIADNIKEVIPEFLLLLKGAIDCPDLPLNVSRSALQNDGFVKKIADYITKKVADKLAGMYKTDRENYEKYWDDISPFIKFGCLKDEKFAEKMNDFIIFKDLDGKYITLKNYLEACKDKHENKVFYVTNENEQGQYINMFKKEGLNALLLLHNIDSPFITSLEQKNEGVHFMRIDADLSEVFKEEVSEDELKDINDKLSELFKKVLNNDKLTVRVDKLKDANISSMITVSEESRRMQEMMKMYGMADMNLGGQDDTLVLNANNDLVKYLFENTDNENTDIICHQLYDLAVLSQRPLTPEQMTGFIERSNKLMKLITK